MSKSNGYKWQEDWDRGWLLMPVWGDEHEDHSNDFYLPDSVPNEELRKLENYGPGITSEIFIQLLQLKYKS